ncbi:alpha-tectorin-like [Anoplopoma fimbria]|uniref:alpha-tectorin-like n=1 Tax=Anoplopoma fimbria TaxID=229290 RepID=UPI0023ED1243|nr:alpha-tectorin-like [Anoplopoma fimbria]
METCPSQRTANMFCFIIYLIALSLLEGTDATNQTFTSSGEMNITSCPITYYGQKYDRVYEADAQVDGLTVSKQKFQTADTINGVITDVSGCRLSGFVYKTNTTVSDPNICSTVTCDVSGVATAVSDCGPMERCQGNGVCVLNAMCSVTGSTVIDFVGRVHSVPDRCGYTLMGSLSFPGLRMLGVFQERRRKDVSFLDRVMLEGPGVQISLEQGGRVKLNDKVLMLNATAQVVHGVELSRDQTGVTAKMSASNYTVSVLFDGYTTLIHTTGPSEAAVDGLCGNSTSSLNDERVTGHWSTGCETEYDDAADSTINCNTTTEWCNLLKQAPFTACNEHINPEPFITACTNTLCKYPAVDGLKCQFLEAYARACSLHSNITMESWRTTTSCPAVPRTFCKDRFCSAHEFCGERNVGEPSCLCRAIFASKYRSTGTLGEPTVCQQSSASVILANCLLEDKSIDYSVLHLNDQACKAEMDNLTHMVMFNYNGSNTCGTVVTANNSEIIYKNTIMTRNISTSGLINRHSPVRIDFSCHYNQPDVTTLAIKIKHSSVIQNMTSGEWNYNLTMKAYTNADRMIAIQPSTDIKLDQKIWVELKTDGLNENMVLVVTDACWATDQPSPIGGLRYDLIIEGCPNPADQTVKVEGNGLGTSNYFSFNTFQFSGKTGGVYLHCKVELCVTQSNACAPLCNQAGRRRRSAMSTYEDENPAFISMAWT